MSLIPAALHRRLDFMTIVAFALAPWILGLAGFEASLSYALAVIHLAMTMLTRFSPADRGPVPLALHGVVESAVGLVLVVLPLFMNWHGTSRVLYMSAGVAILMVWVFSQYRAAVPRAVA